jgi:hypothetical protein
MTAQRHLRFLLVLGLWLLSVAGSAVHGGVLWLRLGSASQPALDAQGAILTLDELRALGIRASTHDGTDLGQAELAGVDEAGAGFLVGVVRIAGAADSPIHLRLGPDAAGALADLGEGTPEPDDFAPCVDPEAHRVVCSELSWTLSCTVTFAAGAGGALSGSVSQTVLYGGSCSAVTAVPAYGFAFAQWSDGATQNPRTVTDVRASMSLSASFRAATAAAPNGPFLAIVDAAADGTRGLWDLSGDYTATVGGRALLLHVLHDTYGRLSGSASYVATDETTVTLSIRGNVKGTSGSVLATMYLRGVAPEATLGATLALDLTLNGDARELVGPITGIVSRDGAQTAVAGVLKLAVPTPMDGSWSLQLRLVAGATTVGGSASLALANGVAYAYIVKGRPHGSNVSLTLASAGDDPAATGISIRAVVTPLEAGWARLNALTAKGYGQTLTW